MTGRMHRGWHGRGRGPGRGGWQQADLPGALADLLHRLSRLGEDLPQVAELDLNPVVGLADRCVAVDARVRVHQPPTQQRLKTW